MWNLTWNSVIQYEARQASHEHARTQQHHQDLVNLVRTFVNRKEKKYW